ncbi:MAG: hypothetical protein LBU11_10245 [Zoogloeaceae bacterium]|nr:hypothetical protein [Zoogloeaceae bacterium]
MRKEYSIAEKYSTGEWRNARRGGTTDSRFKIRFSCPSAPESTSTH